MQIEEELALRARRRLAMSASCRHARMIRACFGRHSGASAVSGSLIGEMFAGADDRETLVIEKPLDLENGFDVLAAIKAVTAGTLHRLERGEFGFPVAQHESFCRGQTAHFADAEETFVRNR